MVQGGDEIRPEGEGPLHTEGTIREAHSATLITNQAQLIQIDLCHHRELRDFHISVAFKQTKVKKKSEKNLKNLKR